MLGRLRAGIGARKQAFAGFFAAGQGQRPASSGAAMTTARVERGNKDNGPRRAGRCFFYQCLLAHLSCRAADRSATMQLKWAAM
jgi:hypothetical protein